MSKPKVIILAGGSNSRFFPLNTKVHKGALKLLGKPLISRTLENLVQSGFKDIIIVQSARDAESGSLQQIVDQTNFDLDIELVTQHEAKGMGNALLTVQDKLQDQFAVIFPDLYNAGDLISEMINLGGDGSVCASETKEPWLYGILELNGDKAISIEEKPEKGAEKSNIKTLGCYLLNQKFISILKELPEAEYNFEEALNKTMQESDIKALILQEAIRSLKFPWHLFKLQSILFKNLKSFTASSAKVSQTAIIDDSKGPVVIEDGARIGDFAKITGPCYIGKKCLVGDYSFIRGSNLEEDSVVGAKTEVVRSIIMNNSTLHFGYLADSIIGPNNQIGAGIITANKRLDRANIATIVKGVKTDTNINALGIITGYGAKLGIRTSTMPGVIIGAEAQIYPGQVVSKNVDHNSTLQKS
jgi:UDP-N-acetylglucosamine diphosphorylase / glucose-1-phosphate thymidylyltransferase / UDP-N-acetylgalactosamine diphosphorylase / glucosamine-1-phosphate N-acetyltransferase / galactosamine-1-phosphate N-acetyltransferase